MTLQRTLALIFAILLAGLSATAQSRAKKDDPDLKEIRDYRLSMDIVEHYIRAVKTGSADAAAKKCFDNNPPGNAPSLDWLMTANADHTAWQKSHQASSWQELAVTCDRALKSGRSHERIRPSAK